jgi:transketolase
MTDILVYLYYAKMNHEIDKFILSKGHAVIGLYSILFDRDIISHEEYYSFKEDGSLLIEHPHHLVKGITASTGALGHGPALAAGLAWGLSMEKKDGTIYCMVGDGESQEGSVWEALLFIARKLFGNLVLIVDMNNYQGFSDSSGSLVSQEVFINMLRATQLDIREIDGHNFEEIESALAGDIKVPRIIIARTTKGKGISFMENKFEWHYKSPDAEQVALALRELV